MGKKVRVCFHDRCFDGTSSAAVFTRFYRERVDAGAVFAYTGLTHKPAGSFFHDGTFHGEENVIVDFKSSPPPRLPWWFDPHQSAFPPPADAEPFRRDSSGRKFYDPH